MNLQQKVLILNIESILYALLYAINISLLCAMFFKTVVIEPLPNTDYLLSQFTCVLSMNMANPRQEIFRFVAPTRPRSHLKVAAIYVAVSKMILKIISSRDC